MSTEFKRYDLVLANEYASYNITNQDNPCIVVGTSDSEIYKNIEDVTIENNEMLVAPLKTKVHDRWAVRKNAFDKINMIKVDKDVELTDATCIYHNLPVGSKCKLIGILDSEWEFSKKFGDAVIYIPKNNAYLITSKCFLKDGEF